MNALPAKQGKISEVLLDRVNLAGKYHLVLVHGIGDTSDVWQKVCTLLPAGFKSYQELSLPWTMAVGDPISYRPAPEEVLREAWQKLPSGPKIVLAHSFGANAILAMIQQQPLVDVCAMVMVSVYSKPKYSDFTWPLFVSYVNEFEKFIVSSIAVRQGAKNLSSVSKGIVVEKVKNSYSPSSWIEFYMIFSQTPGLNLSSLTLPILVLAGEEDFSIEQQDIKQFTSRLPNAEFYCMENCGHFSMLEQPEYTAKLINKFLTQRKML